VGVTTNEDQMRVATSGPTGTRCKDTQKQGKGVGRKPASRDHNEEVCCNLVRIKKEKKINLRGKKKEKDQTSMTRWWQSRDGSEKLKRR